MNKVGDLPEVLLSQDRVLCQQLKFAHRAIEVTLAAASKLRWESQAQRIAIALHGTIIELFAGCIALVETDRPAGIPIILRSQYEALVDLENLLTDVGHLERMEAANLRQLKELLVQGRINPLMQGIQRTVDVVAELKTVGPRLADLERDGKGPLSIKDRCKGIGREREYRTVYALFTLDVHNNIAALADRHFNNGGAPDQVGVFSQPSLSAVRGRIGMAVQYLVQSTLKVHQAFGTADADVERLPIELQVMREAIGDISLP